MNLVGVLKLTGSSYLPGLSAGPHSCDADCGADGTAGAAAAAGEAAVEVVARGGSDLGWQNLRLGWGSERGGEVLEANPAHPRESWSQDWVCSSAPSAACVAPLALEQQGTQICRQGCEALHNKKRTNKQQV
jgi:hypothetical protein